MGVPLRPALRHRVLMLWLVAWHYRLPLLAAQTASAGTRTPTVFRFHWRLPFLRRTLGRCSDAGSTKV